MKFKEIKNMTTWELLTLLQNLVKENAKKIKNNSEISLSNEIDEDATMNKSESGYSSKSDEFKNAYLQNSKYIDLHHKLFSFLSELSQGILDENLKITDSNIDTKEIEKIKEFEFQYCMEETIKGAILFNSEHPFYDNKEFISSLINEYSLIEEYEKCAELLKRIKVLQ